MKRYDDGLTPQQRQRERRAGRIPPVLSPEASREQRFWSKVEKTENCWIWHGNIARGGYGLFWLGPDRPGGKQVTPAHRWAYEAVRGQIPEGLQLDHLCRVRACVNPDHLQPVTAQVNTLRSFSPAAYNARKTHCIHGHELTAENTKQVPEGRKCRRCQNDAARRSQQKQRSTWSDEDRERYNERQRRYRATRIASQNSLSE